jgi:hypothetical protein
MPSTYTLNNGIELIGTGEQSGTWGDTTNTNLGLLDAALDGQVTVALASAGSSGSPNSLPITDGTASNGRNRMVVFSDSGDLGATAYVQLTPNDAEKIIYIRNSLSGSRSVILFQGTYNASNDYEVPAGTTAVVYFDGAGAGAVAANVFNNAYFDGLRLGSVSVTAILDEDNMASDSATALATQQSIKAYVDSQVGTVDTLAEILAIGNTTGATDIAVDSAQKVQFRDAAIYINSSVDGQLDIVADTEIQIAATTVDLNGNLDVSGTLGVTGVLTATSLDISGDIDVDGTTNLDVVDIDGAVDMASTLLVTGVLTTTAATVSNGGGQFNGAINVGIDDTGYDVKFFGATAGAYMLWDESADDLILGGAAGLSVNSAALVTGVLTTTAATVFNGGFASNANSTVGGTLITTGNMSISETGADNEKSLTIVNSSVSGALIGVEGSGGNRFVGSAVNNMFMGTTGADGLEFATNNTVRANIAANGAASFNGVLTANAGVVVDNFTLDGTTLALSSGDLTLDVAGDIILNADGGDWKFQDGATGILEIQNDGTGNAVLITTTSDKDIRFLGNDGGSTITALTLDMSDAGAATFNNDVNVGANFGVTGDAVIDGTALVTGVLTTTAATVFNGGFASNAPSTISSANNLDTLQLISTDADANAGPNLRFYRNSGSPADNDLMAKVDFEGRNDNSQDVVYASIENYALDVSDGTEDGELTFYTIVNGTSRNRLDFTNTQTVFNESSVDVDFRVESDANTHMLFVDGGQSAVAIGNATASYAFHINENRAGNYVFGVTNDGNNVDRYGMIMRLGTDDGSSTSTYIAFDDGDGSGVGAITGSGGTITYATFTAVHPAILPDADNENGYAYGTLLDTTEITYSKRKNGQETERGIRYKVVKSASANSRAVLGAYAGKDPKYDNEHLVNVLGDGHILCNNSGGNIAVGDGVCTSATVGIGQKATASPSMIIGIAQEAVTFANNTETKLVAVQYGLQQFTPWS